MIYETRENNWLSRTGGGIQDKLVVFVLARVLHNSTVCVRVCVCVCLLKLFTETCLSKALGVVLVPDLPVNELSSISLGSEGVVV